MMKRIIVLGMFSIFLFTGCTEYGGGTRVESSPHRVDNMPPPHAPAHGRRRQQYHYYYYPHAEFYFDVGRNMYFYLDSRGRWAVSVTLPYHLRHHLRDHYVEFTMGSDKPYTEHYHHKKKYKRKKPKKSKYYRYYYYPQAEFYFDIGRNMYFYLDSRGRWAVSVTLPSHLRRHLHDHRFELRMESDRPYTEHRHHRKKYKKKKYNKGKDKRDKKKYDDNNRYRDR